MTPQPDTPVYTVQAKVSSRAKAALKARQNKTEDESNRRPRINEIVAAVIEEWAKN